MLVAGRQRRVSRDEAFLVGLPLTGLLRRLLVTGARIAVASETGLVRPRNEDSAYVGRWLCAVADGMGGHAAGDVASATVLDAITPFDAFADAGQLTAVLGSAVLPANSGLTARSKGVPELASMGSTLTALLWSGTHVGLAHIGDSRAYRLRAGALRQITEDHHLGNLVAAPMPVRISEYLVRYLDARPGWSPDLTVSTVQPGDRYLICSDGLSGFTSAGAIRDVLADRAEVTQAAEDLVALAYAAGAPDNVTVVVADVPDGAWTERNGSPVVAGAAAELAGGR